MVTTHGENWHREVHLPLLWVCPLCNDDDATFTRPQDLTEHIRKQHGSTVTEPQIQAIVRQSRLRFPRQQDLCPLCCLPTKDEEEPSSKEMGLEEQSPENDRDRESLGYNPKRIKTKAGDTQWAEHSSGGAETATEQPGPNTQVEASRSQRVNPEVIASHVAAHLQGVMVLTLRMISIDAAIDISAHDQSVSGIADHDSSRVGSGQKDPMREDMDIGESLHEDGDIDPDNVPFELIPDSASDSWRDIPHYEEVPMEKDKLLRAVITTGAFQSHLVKGTPPPIAVSFLSLYQGTKLLQDVSTDQATVFRARHRMLESVGPH